MNDLREQLISAFHMEQKEYLEGIRAILSRTDMAGGNGTPSDLEEAFRLAHSLKAASRVCDFSIVEKIGQGLESLFAQVRRGTLPLSKERSGVVRSVLKAIEEWATGLEAQQNPPEPKAALVLINRLLGGEIKSPVQAAPVDDLTPKLLAAFQIEHKEHLEGIRAFLAGIERGTSESHNVDEAFRRAHSLKGAARLAELRSAEMVAHRLETLFARVREGTLLLNPEVVRVIQQGLDAIEDGAAALLEHKDPPDSSRTLEAIDRIMGEPPSAHEAILEPETPPAPLAAPVTPAVTTGTMGPSQPVETVRVSADNLDRLLRCTGQLLTENLRQNLVTRELGGLSREIAALQKEWDFLRNTSSSALRLLAATPELSRVAQFVNLVEQQMRSLSRRARTVRILQQHSSWTLGLLGRQLQQEVRRVRMVSAESIFQGFRKMMRDLARDEGKEIDFRVSGFEIEADRMVLQALKDSLMHMLCNAVSHGIEVPEERKAMGKSGIGRISLHIETLGSRLRIVVEDDGRGIDYGKVADVAVRRGLLSKAEAAAMPPEELVRFIFQPGFSTSRVVTGLSGRGMGLSVVYETATRLQGEIDLEPNEGSGSRMILTVPLSISTQRILLVSCRDQTFAIPVHAIEQLLRVKLSEIEQVEGKPMLLVEDQPIPLLTLANLLKMEDVEVNISEDFLPVMILRAGTRCVAVAVDVFLIESDTLIKDLDDPAAQLSTLSGGILLEDGAIALVLNPTELIKSFKPSDKNPMLKTAAARPEKKAVTVLVVDDSLTTRTLEKSLLEAHGYRVRIAMDGLEALTQLQGELPDLVITDIQMPRMDGFGLLAAIKKDQRLAHVPVIVVTSMEKREDQERGLALGADAYIVKRKFDHQELLQTIRQII